MKKRISTFAVLVLCLVSSGCVRLDVSTTDYLSMLKALRGTSYWTLQCSTYITTAKHFQKHCGAAGFYNNGCDGALDTVAVLPNITAINPVALKPGDVLAFGGVHVAAYVGDGKFMDSDPQHGGVGDMTPNGIKGDAWFKGQVKILRWRS